MSRRRYISTDISSDAAVNRLALEHGDFAALLYTWLIPHAGDDGAIRGTAEEILFVVAPGRRDKEPADIEHAFLAMESLGLLTWNPEDRILQFPAESFYRYQSYIKGAHRRGDSPSPENAGKRRTSSHEAASLTVPPSSSVSVSSSVSSPPPSRAHATDGGGVAAVQYDMTDPSDERAHELYGAVVPYLNIVGHATAERRLYALVERWIDGDLSDDPDPVQLVREWHEVIGHSRDSQMGRVTSLTEYAQNHLPERRRDRPHLQLVRDDNPPDYTPSSVEVWNDLRAEIHRQTHAGTLDKKFHFMSDDWGFQTFDAVSFDGSTLVLTMPGAGDSHYRQAWSATIRRLAASRGQDLTVKWLEDGYAAVG